MCLLVMQYDMKMTGFIRNSFPKCLVAMANKSQLHNYESFSVKKTRMPITNFSLLSCRRKRSSEHRSNIKRGRASPGKHWRECRHCRRGGTPKFVIIAQIHNKRERLRAERELRELLADTFGI